MKKLQFCFFPLAEKILWKLAQIGNPTGQQNPTFHRTITSFKGVKIDVGHSKLKKPTIEKFVLTSGEKNSKQKRFFLSLEMGVPEDVTFIKSTFKACLEALIISHFSGFY